MKYNTALQGDQLPHRKLISLKPSGLKEKNKFRHFYKISSAKAHLQIPLNLLCLHVSNFHYIINKNMCTNMKKLKSDGWWTVGNYDCSIPC